MCDGKEKATEADTIFGSLNYLVGPLKTRTRVEPSWTLFKTFTASFQNPDRTLMQPFRSLLEPLQEKMPVNNLHAAAGEDLQDLLRTCSKPNPSPKPETPKILNPISTNDRPRASSKRSAVRSATQTADASPSSILWERRLSEGLRV